MLLQVKRPIFYLLLSCVLCWRPGKAHAHQPAAQRYLESLQKKVQQYPQTQEEVQAAKGLFVDGVLELLLDQPEQAYAHLQQALQMDPLNAAIHFKLAHLLHQYPQLAEEQGDTHALKHIYTAMALAPDNPFYYTATVMIHTSQGEYHKATQVYEQMFQHIAPTDDMLFHLAGLYIAQKGHRQAIRVYNQIEQRRGVMPMLTKQKQSIYLAMNDLDGAVEEGVKLIKAYPSIETYVIHLAQLLSNNGRAQHAIPYLQENLVPYPGHAQARLHLVYLLLEKGDHEQALVHIKIALPETSLPLCTKLSLITTYIKHLPTTASSADHEVLAQVLCQTYPHCAQVYAVCGDLYLAFESIEQAIFYYHQALALDKGNYDWWQNLIALYIRQKNAPQVQHWTQKALQQFPDQVGLHYYYGVACLQQKKYQQAVEVLKKGETLALKPAVRQLFHRYLGDAYHELQQYAQAGKCYEEALHIAPDDCYVLNNYSYSLTLRKEELSLAQEMAAKLIKCCPDNANYLDTYAWVLYQLGHYRKAKKYLKKAIALSEPEVNREIFKHYGDVLEQLGQHKEAVVQWERAQYKELEEIVPKK